MIGMSEVMQKIYRELGSAARVDVPVLLLGETGAGKELAARAVHQHSARHAGPFVAVNCPALPDTLFESELFGHEKGAYTGADSRKIGKFELANHGTIFLDEIAELTVAAQAKLLRVLQEHELHRLGGSGPVRIDVRVIAATNRDLENLVAAGRFREDLFYRLKVFCIHLPPLRTRDGDVGRLAEHFVQVFCGQLGRVACPLDPEVIRLLQAYPWPGNVRELQSVIQYALAQASTDTLTVDCLPDDLRHGQTPEPSLPDITSLVSRLVRAGSCDILNIVSTMAQRAALVRVLQEVAGNKRRAAKRLGISRTNLDKKLLVSNSEQSNL